MQYSDFFDENAQDDQVFVVWKMLRNPLHRDSFMDAVAFDSEYTHINPIDQNYISREHLQNNNFIYDWYNFMYDRDEMVFTDQAVLFRDGQLATFMKDFVLAVELKMEVVFNDPMRQWEVPIRQKEDNYWAIEAKIRNFTSEIVLEMQNLDEELRELQDKKRELDDQKRTLFARFKAFFGFK